MLAHAKVMMVGGLAAALVLGTSTAQAQGAAPPPPNALPPPPPPATNPPAANPPATNPPATNPPATNPPAASTNTSTAGASTADANEVTGKKMRIGADLELALPIGDLSDIAGFGFGLLGRFEYKVLEKLAVTGRAGFVYHLDKEIVPGFDLGIAYIPVRGGVKYMIMDPNEGLYVGGELALNLVFARSSGTFFGQNVSSSDSELWVGLGPSIGYQLDKLDFRLGFNTLKIDDLTDTFLLTANAGYSFAEF